MTRLLSFRCSPDWYRVSPAMVLCAFAAFIAGCGSTAVTSTGPSPVKCAVSLDVPANVIGASGGSNTVSVTTAPECAWTAAAEVSWVSRVTPASGQGSGQVDVQVAANPSATARQGDVVINGQRATIRQEAAPCRFEIAPASSTMESAGGAGQVSVTTITGCSWTATSSVAWISIAGAATGTGNGTVAFTVAANSGSARTGSIAIADQTITITQAAGNAQSVCTYSVTPPTLSVPLVGGPSSFNVTSTCPWTATSNAPWLTIVTGATGNGSGIVTVSVAANTGAARTATLTIGTENITVSQAGTGSCAYTVNMLSQPLPAAGGAGPSVTVSTQTGCPWTAASNVPWLTITSGASGSGNGAVAFTAAANTGATRTGTLTVASQSIMVTQSAGCTYTVNAPVTSIAAAGGSGLTASVTAATGCTWSATSSATWLTITAGASGSGNGTVTFSASANTGSARTATLTIANQGVTITQAGSCSYTVEPPTVSIGAAGGAGTSIAVSTATGCTWTAASNATWLTITSGASGSGNGTVAISASANTGAARTAMVTVANRSVTVTQSAACSFSVNPTTLPISALGVVGTPIGVTAATGCAWTATSNASWIVVLTGSSGSGNGTVSATVLPNVGSARTGTLTVAGQTVTVNQAAPCVYAINPTNLSIRDDGGSGQTTSVITTAGCAWTATSNASWLTITAGASGSGPGTVTFRVDANPDGKRTGTLTVAGETFTVDQSNK